MEVEPMQKRVNPFATVNGVKEKRAVLSRLSAQAKSIQKQLIKGLSQQEGNFAVPRVNDILLNIYSGDEQLEWNTFQGWLKQGKKVKKNEKAWVIWSKPRKVEKEITEEQKEEYELFGLCFMFSSDQVQ